MVARLLRTAPYYGVFLLVWVAVSHAWASGIVPPNALFPQFSWASAPPLPLKPLAQPPNKPPTAASNVARQPQPRTSTSLAPGVDPFAACAAAIQQAQTITGTPAGLLRSIAMVESGRRNPATGQIAPWPWTIDANGAGHFYATESQAIAAVRQLRAQGIQAIDVGCLQIDLAAHPSAFATLHDAFDPLSNALYGAHFLQTLHTDLGHWDAAIGGYHSLNPSLGDPYYQKVAAVWRHHAGSASPVAASPNLILAAAKPTGPIRPIKPKPKPGAVAVPRGFGAGSFQFAAPPLRMIQAPAGGMSLAAYRARPVLIAGAR
jgi:hypothetical protein